MLSTPHVQTVNKVLVLFAAMLFFAATLAGCGSGDSANSGGGGGGENSPQESTTARSEEGEAPPKEPPKTSDGEGRAPVLVRLSGAPGTVYAGNYGNLDSSEYAEGVLEDKPLEFEVNVRDSGFDVVDVSFVKPQPKGSLSVEMLVDGQVVNQMDTDSQYGALRLSWSFGG